MSEKNKEIVEKVNALIAEGNTDGFLSLCAEDLEWQMVGEKTTKGKDAIREWMGSMASENADHLPKFTVDNLIADGESVVANGDMTMKDKDGETVPYSYCDIYRFSDGKIAELKSFVIKTQAKTDNKHSATA